MTELKEKHYLNAIVGNKFASKFIYSARLKIFKHLELLIDFNSLDNILDVGVCSVKDELSTNFFELLFPNKSKIVAFSDQDASWMENEFPGLKFVQGDGCNLPFESDSFDLVFSSAVIEHVGNFERQLAFLRECYRVSKKYVFLTTPNRFHPLEFHTSLPFIHWLPKSVHRKILSFLGFKDLSLEENMNLLDAKYLSLMCKSIPINSYTIYRNKFFLFTSNLLLFCKK
ncbi:MAG: class I SAM-dependent methyltransferase [Deltaproteobacteria bacterium]|jgi:hypothetical protein|nr:class I SAM-dependent methyltransferase [Deltaproteobacteria bacterium]